MKKKKMLFLSCACILCLQLTACSSSSSEPTATTASAETNTTAQSSSNEAVVNSTINIDTETDTADESGYNYSDVLDAINYNSVCYYGLRMSISLTDEQETQKTYIGIVPSVVERYCYPAEELEATETVFNVGDEIYYIETGEFGICFLKKNADGYEGLVQCITTVSPDYYH